MDGKIIETSLLVRTEIEKFAIKNNRIGDPVTLECYCAIASYSLNKTFKALKLDSSFVTGFYYDSVSNSKSFHCWVEHSQSIIDITATQFGIKHRVYIPKLPCEDSLEDFKDGRATKYINENWHPNQTIKQNLNQIKEIVKVTSKSAKKLIFS